MIINPAWYISRHRILIELIAEVDTYIIEQMHDLSVLQWWSIHCKIWQQPHSVLVHRKENRQVFLIALYGTQVSYYVCHCRHKVYSFLMHNNMMAIENNLIVLPHCMCIVIKPLHGTNIWSGWSAYFNTGTILK